MDWLNKAWRVFREASADWQEDNAARMGAIGLCWERVDWRPDMELPVHWWS